MTTDIVAHDRPQMSPLEIAAMSDTPNKLLALAIANGTSPETLSKLMDLQERWEASTARKEYVQAMSEFKKAAPPAIIKQSRVDFTSGKGRTNYNYANLGDVVSQTAPLLAKHGLHAAWETATPKDGPITVTCHITHAAGHRESVSLCGPADNSGNKNAIQAIGSCVTYLQRYTLLAALGLATMEDDDGHGGPAKAESVNDHDEERKVLIKEAWEEALRSGTNAQTLQKLLAAAEEANLPVEYTQRIKDKIASLIPAPDEPKQEAKAPAKFSWAKGTPQSRTRFSLESIQSAPTPERVNEISKGVEKAKADIGEDNWRLVCEAATKREKELAPQAPEESGSPFDAEPAIDPDLEYLRQAVAEKRTTGEIDALAKIWQEDSERLTDDIYQAGCLILSKARASLPA